MRYSSGQPIMVGDQVTVDGMTGMGPCYPDPITPDPPGGHSVGFPLNNAMPSRSVTQLLKGGAPL